MAANVAVKSEVNVAPENMLSYVERRLDEWAHWFSRGNGYGLGYPPCSVEYRLMKEGVFAGDRGRPRTIPVNEKAEEIEQLVQAMTRQNESMALALRSYYFNGYSLRRQAKEAGISHMHLKALVDMGKQWMVGCVTGANGRLVK